MRIPIVNEQDEIIAYKEREETVRQDIRRIVSLNVFNERGDVLIAKRHHNKKLDPDKWGPSVAGTVDEGYGYDDTVTTEAEEEIGLKDKEPIFFKKIFYETPNARRFLSAYYVTINSAEIKMYLQEEEVCEIKWITVSELDAFCKESPENFVQGFHLTLEHIKEISEKIIKK